MEKPPSPPPHGSRELQCVGKLEIVSPKPVGFLCGSIPVLTDSSYHAFNTALIPSQQTVAAPQYRVLPTETDLNRPPLVSNFSEKTLPVGVVPSKTIPGDLCWEDGVITSNLARKCEALAVSGLVEYGEDIDVIAPTDILKKIFKMPYAKGRLSIAVHRVGQTLVLNTGPDVEEGEKLIRRRNNQSAAKSADPTLFLNFAMHSVRMEACDCPPGHNSTATSQQPKSSVLPQGDVSRILRKQDDVTNAAPLQEFAEDPNPKTKKDDIYRGAKKSGKSKRKDPVKQTSQVGEKPRYSMQDSERHRRVGNDGFLRVLFWQFHNFRMLLGSDLLLFSNEKYVAVSLHLWDVTRQVTPLTWLEAWLDNVMASVPELAICYHENGVVQGYELLKTEDVFLVKGISDDGTPAFNPHVVQQNGLSVLRFLQENCKQDPGAYWLYKSAGEDVLQLFSLSAIPKAHSSTNCDDSSSSLPSLMHRGRSDQLFSLGTLLYRIAHRLSLSVAPENKAKCASFIRKCLDFLDEPDHLVVLAFAHEQYARLILDNGDEDPDVASEYLPVESEATIGSAEEESLDFLSSILDCVANDDIHSVNVEGNLTKEGEDFHESTLKTTTEMLLEETGGPPRNLMECYSVDKTKSVGAVPCPHSDETLCVTKMPAVSAHVVQTVADPISSKLAAIHHVSQAIKSVRWMRQLQGTETELDCHSAAADKLPSSMKLSICACGDSDCIEVCDIREWLPKSKLDHKLWKLVLLLGESYLALAQAYKEDEQLHQALKVVELACSVYGSMPQHLGEARFISSMVNRPTSLSKLHGRGEKMKSSFDVVKEVNTGSDDPPFTLEQFSSTYLFWAKAWTLVGDIYVEFHIIKGREASVEGAKQSVKELRMSSEVVKEVKRLKKKLGQNSQNCRSCSLLNCSCESDRASSGNSASSRSGDANAISYGRRHSKRSSGKSNSKSHFEDAQDKNSYHKIEEGIDSGRRRKTDISPSVESSELTVDAESSKTVEGNLNMHGGATSVVGTTKVTNGGIFKFIEGLGVVKDGETNLLAALSCYKEARKALGGLPAGSAELHSVIKKKGWVWNELGRNRLNRKELSQAEMAFSGAIDAFRQVFDHINIILINCNMGHGRRALAEEMVARIEQFRLHPIFRSAYNQALITAKFEYSEALKFYGAAKSELSAVEEAGSVSDSLKNEVYTQFGHTYLRLGMLLAREDITAEVYENASLEELSVVHGRAKKETRKNEISANDALREALAMYKLLGELRKQEAAYAYFQLGCHQMDCCLKFLDPDNKKGSSKSENGMLQRAKQYSSLAERNWQKAMDFYSPKTHPTMYLTILVERSKLSFTLSSLLHSNAMLESALSRLLEGRHIADTISDSFETDYPEINAKFWSQLQMVLKRMVGVALSSPSSGSNRYGDSVKKLKELYKMSLKCTSYSELHQMNTLWIEVK